MKKLLLLIFPIAIATSLSAQITILSTDMPAVPSTLTNAIDTVHSGLSVGAAGANATWDFSGLLHHTTETAQHKTTTQAGSGYSTTYPTATDAVTTDGAKYAFFKNASAAYTAQGIAGDLLGTGTPISVTFSPTFDVYRFPSTYSNQFNGTYGFTKTISGSSVNQPVYQVRATYTAQYWDTIDAWGTVKTPMGTYNSQREKHKEYTHTVVEYQLTPISPWTSASDTRDTTLAYNWLAKETKGAVVTIGFNKSGVINRASYSLTPPAPIAAFTYVVNGGGVAQFTNTSQNSPTSYAWTFGDGSTSTATSPSHTYLASNTYNVCLIATNVSGSDTQCTNVPVVINTSAPFHAAIVGNVQPCSNHATGLVYSDSVRSGNSYSWTATGGNITAGAGTHSVTVDWNGVSAHSLRLIECNNGGSYCDTVTITVTINAPLTGAFTEHICDGSSYTFNGRTVTNTGDYYDTITASTGCDSIVTLSLVVDPTVVPYDTIVTSGTYAYGTNNVYCANVGVKRAAANDYFDIVVIPTNGGGSPTFAWYIDTTFTGVTSDTFMVIDSSGRTDSLLMAQLITGSQGRLTCRMTSADPCAQPQTVTSNIVYLVLCGGVEETALTQSINLYPNPSNGNFTISITQPTQQLKIELLNIQGQILYTEQLKEQSYFKKELDLSGIAKGVYLLKVNTENGVAVKRVVVE